jgi:hypothetical protein
VADRLNEPPQIARATDDHTAPAGLPSAVRLGRRGRPHREASPHSNKFRVAIALLIGIGIGAIVIAVGALNKTDHSTPTFVWSAWRPVDTGSQGASEIADHIAPTYRISSVNQLDVVTVVNLANPSASASANGTSNGTANGTSGGLEVAVRQNPASSQVSLLGGNTIAYNLCGIGTTNCAIGPGQASAQRLLLLKREALELALYTFKYISGTQNVVAILPPGRTVQTSSLTSTPPKPGAKLTSKPVDVALLFLRQELQPWLSRPLSDTFPEQFPPSVPQLGTWSQTDEAGLVAQITADGLFTEKLVTAQDGTNLIVLDPQPPQ